MMESARDISRIEKLTCKTKSNHWIYSIVQNSPKPAQFSTSFLVQLICDIRLSDKIKKSAVFNVRLQAFIRNYQTGITVNYLFSSFINTANR